MRRISKIPISRDASVYIPSQTWLSRGLRLTIPAITINIVFLITVKTNNLPILNSKQHFCSWGLQSQFLYNYTYSYGLLQFSPFAFIQMNVRLCVKQQHNNNSAWKTQTNTSNFVFVFLRNKRRSPKITCLTKTDAKFAHHKWYCYEWKQCNIV